jgi:hypothetical protein
MRSANRSLHLLFVMVAVSVAAPSPAHGQCAVCRYTPGAWCMEQTSGGWKNCVVFDGICDHGPACVLPEGLQTPEPDDQGYIVSIACDGTVEGLTTVASASADLRHNVAVIAFTRGHPELSTASHAVRLDPHKTRREPRAGPGT